MEFNEEHEQHEEEMEEIHETHQPLNSTRPNTGPSSTEAASSARKTGTTFRYRECLKNHAVSIGGHAVDGCGEFIAAGEEGTLDALNCAACNCHRNFHRKETDSAADQGLYAQYHHYPQQHHQYTPPYYRGLPPPPSGYLHLTTPPTQPRPLALPAVSGGGRDDEGMSNPSSSGGGSGSGKKRFRTKFSQEQKEKMLEFAERLGWKIQKHDEAAVEEFCAETGLNRHVLKVWMHNNKHTLGKKL